MDLTQSAARLSRLECYGFDSIGWINNQSWMINMVMKSGFSIADGQKARDTLNMSFDKNRVISDWLEFASSHL